LLRILECPLPARSGGWAIPPVSGLSAKLSTRSRRSSSSLNGLSGRAGSQEIVCRTKVHAQRRARHVRVSAGINGFTPARPHRRHRERGRRAPPTHARVRPGTAPRSAATLAQRDAAIRARSPRRLQPGRPSRVHARPSHPARPYARHQVVRRDVLVSVTQAGLAGRCLELRSEGASEESLLRVIDRVRGRARDVDMASRTTHDECGARGGEHPGHRPHPIEQSAPPQEVSRQGSRRPVPPGFPPLPASHSAPGRS